MVAGSEEDARNPSGPQSVQEGLVIRHDDGPLLRGEVEERVIRGAVTFDDPIVFREFRRGPGVPVVVRQQVELRQDGRRNRDLDIANHAPELRVEMDLELEWHQEGVRIQQDESRHRFRASMPNYLALR